MQWSNFRKIFGCILIGWFIFIIAVPGYSMYVGNYSGNGFSGPGETSGISSTKAGATIDFYIIRSAKHFLLGKSQVDQLAALLEAAEHDGVDYFELQQIANEALWNMHSAQNYYQKLINLAAVTPYNQTVLSQLASFDYNTFAKDNKLNKDIYDYVSRFLQSGDIRGSYHQFLTHTGNIIRFLEILQTDFYSWRIPEPKAVWNLNQECAQMLLFGQYIAQTFKSL
jgi:hypothetical protein